MKFQNTRLIFLTDGRMDRRADIRTCEPKAICSLLFQSWWHNNDVDFEPQTPCIHSPSPFFTNC